MKKILYYAFLFLFVSCSNVNSSNVISCSSNNNSSEVSSINNEIKMEELYSHNNDLKIYGKLYGTIVCDGDGESEENHFRAVSADMHFTSKIRSGHINAEG